MAFVGIVPLIIMVGVNAGLAWLSKAINPTPQSGRLGQDDFHTLESAYDLPLPKCWGVERVPGNITWIGPVIEHKYNVGGSLLSDGTDVFYYTQDVEYSFTLGEAKAFVKIWLGDKVIYDVSSAPSDSQSGAYGNSLYRTIGNLLSGAAKDRLMESYELFLGTETQQPSNIVSSIEGYGTVPADRGVVKIVIKTLNLTKLGGNSLPAASAIIQFADYIPVPGGDQIVQATAATATPSGYFPPASEIQDVTLTSGTIVRTLSAPLASGSDAILTWSDFSCSTLPSGATITAIYPVATVTRRTELGVCYCNVGGQMLYGPAGGTSGDFGPTKLTGGSIGTSLTDLIGNTAYIRNNSTINSGGGFNDVLTAKDVGFEIHYMTDMIPPTGTTLGAILADLFHTAGLAVSEYTIASNVASIPVKGFKTEQKAVRDVVRELMEIYPFDGYEGDGKLNIVHRAGDPADTITEDDLVLSSEGDKGYRLSEPIIQENEIPMKVDVHYADIDRDFQDNVQHSKRIIEPAPTMESISVKSVSTNVVMNANEATQAAERIVWEPWATRYGANGQLMPKKIRLDPSDKIQINYKSRTLIQRIMQASLGAVLGVELATVSHDSDIYASSALGVSNGATFPIPILSTADPGLVNVPVMFEPPTSLVPPGAAGVLWIQVSGGSPNYGGCEVFISLDGVTYNSLGDMLPGITGYLLTDYPVGIDPDIADVLSVDLTECSGDLANRTRSTADAFLDLTYVGVNASPAIRDFELICPTTATESATANVYSLSGYARRGVYASDILDHPIASRFADLTGALRINLSSAWLGVTLYFKFAAYNLSNQHPAHQQASDLSECAVYTYVPAGTAYQVYVDGVGISHDLLASIDGAGPFTLSPGV